MLKTPLGNLLRDSRPDEAAQARMWDQVRARTTTRRRPILWLAPALAAAAALVIWLGVRGPHHSMVLDDGSWVDLEPGASFELDGRSARLKSGRVTLSVRGPRRIQLDRFAVVSSGGRFVVAAYSARAEVRVLEGEVTLELPSGSRTLRAGEEWQEEPLPPPKVLAPPPPKVETPPPKAELPKPKPRETWRALAAENKYREAYDALHREAATPPVRATLDELLGRADVARLSGHALEAVPLLDKIVDEFPEDRRAALAAFTLGRIHADELGQPKKAARTFHRALELGLPPALAEDAWARAVESELAAGDRDAAEKSAAEYRARFPGGRHRQRIDRWLAR